MGRHEMKIPKQAYTTEFRELAVKRVKVKPRSCNANLPAVSDPCLSLSASG